MFSRILNLCTNLGKNFTFFFFLFEVEVFNWDQNGQKNTDISVYSNLLKKIREKIIIQNSWIMWRVHYNTQFKSYFRPPKYLPKSASEVWNFVFAKCLRPLLGKGPSIYYVSKGLGGWVSVLLTFSTVLIGWF